MVEKGANVRELDVVRLVGTVVSLHGGVATVELADGNGRTLALVDILIADLKAMQNVEPHHHGAEL